MPEGGRLGPEDLALYLHRLKGAIEFAGDVGQMVRDDEARELWKQVYPALSEGGLGLAGAVTSRAEAQVTRLQLLFALLDMSRTIRKPHLEAALAVWSYCEASAYHIFGGMTSAGLAERILSKLRAVPGGLTRNDLRNAFHRNMPSEAIGQALDALQASGKVRSVVEEHTGGRPAKRWFAV